jgi:hypothetical protein
MNHLWQQQNFSSHVNHPLALFNISLISTTRGTQTFPPSLKHAHYTTSRRMYCIAIGFWNQQDKHHIIMARTKQTSLRSTGGKACRQPSRRVAARKASAGAAAAAAATPDRKNKNHVFALWEIRKYQKNIHLLLPKAPFGRLVSAVRHTLPNHGAGADPSQLDPRDHPRHQGRPTNTGNRYKRASGGNRGIHCGAFRMHEASGHPSWMHRHRLRKSFRRWRVGRLLT